MVFCKYLKEEADLLVSELPPFHHPYASGYYLRHIAVFTALGVFLSNHRIGIASPAFSCFSTDTADKLFHLIILL